MNAELLTVAVLDGFITLVVILGLAVVISLITIMLSGKKLGWLSKLLKNKS